ncbi:MAG: hypothetical protein U1F61_05485 [Opitutaceae bacterium]
MKTQVSCATPEAGVLLDVRRHWLRVPKIRLFQVDPAGAGASPFTSPAHTPVEVSVFLNGKVIQLPSK